MKDPIILKSQQTLSPREDSYWKDLLYRVTKIGTEIEVAPPKGMKRGSFEENIRGELVPSHSAREVGGMGYTFTC